MTKTRSRTKTARPLQLEFEGEAGAAAPDVEILPLAKVSAAAAMPMRASVRKSARLAAKVSQIEGSQRRVVEPLDGDMEAWRPAVMAVLGTTSPHFVDACLQRLIHACSLPGESRAQTTSMSAALALIQGLAPENEAEAMLAVHIACLDGAATSVLNRVGRYGMDRGLVYMSTAASRLERALHSALLTYYRMKRGSTQVIRVEKIEIQPGAQAVVGQVRVKPREQQS